MKHTFHDNYLPNLASHSRFQLKVVMVFLLFVTFNVATNHSVQGQIASTASTTARLVQRRFREFYALRQALLPIARRTGLPLPELPSDGALNSKYELGKGMGFSVVYTGITTKK